MHNKELNAGKEVLYRDGTSPRYWIQEAIRLKGKRTTYTLVNNNGRTYAGIERSAIEPKYHWYSDFPNQNDDQTPSTIQFTRRVQHEAGKITILKQGDKATWSPEIAEDNLAEGIPTPTFTILSQPLWEPEGDLWYYQVKNDETGERTDEEAQCLVLVKKEGEEDDE